MRGPISHSSSSEDPLCSATLEAPSASSKNLETSAEIAALVSRSLRFLCPLLIGALHPRTLRTRAVQRWIHHSWQGMSASTLGPSLVGRLGARGDSVGPEDEEWMV